jgi:4-amino-4-deoxy-L-arabinose transferase-like glycosyltransferase
VTSVPEGAPQAGGGTLGTPFQERIGTILLVLAAMIVFAKLGATHLAAFDDCYYAQKAKEMVRSGDWFTPHFAGHPRWDNPPLFLWMMAAAFSALGVNNWAAIFWSALSGVLAVGLTYRLASASRLGLTAFGAFTAAVVLLTTQYFLKYARHAMIDVFLSFLFLAAMWGYVGAVRGDRRQFLILGAAAGLGVMAKSVLGLFPLTVAALHLIGTGRARRLFDPWFLASLVVFAAVGLPWYLLQLAANGDRFVNEHFRWLLVGQVIGPDGAGRSWTSYFDYLRGIALVYWPWLPLALGGLVLAARRAFASAPASTEWSDRDTARLLLLWLFLVVGVMSLAGEKKLWYVMSAFPCLALLAGIAAETWIRSDARRARLRNGAIVVLAALGIAMCLAPGPFSKDRRPDLHAIALATRQTVPPGVVLLNLDARYWKLANQFLFYSDHDVTEPLGDPERVRSGLRAGGFALLTDRGYDQVAEGDSTTYRVLAASGSWRLVAGPGHRPVILSAGRGD